MENNTSRDPESDYGVDNAWTSLPGFRVRTSIDDETRAVTALWHVEEEDAEDQRV